MDLEKANKARLTSSVLIKIFIHFPLGPAILKTYLSMISAMCFSTSTIETAPSSDTSDKRPRQHFNGGKVTGPQEFMEFVNESGGVVIRKFGPIPRIGGFRSILNF